MDLMTNKTIRHSSLPKLAECPCFENKPGEAGAAAARGTRLDAAFRAGLSQEKSTVELLVEELAAVAWAVATVEDLARGAKILSADEECKVRTPGMEHVGTADAIIPERFLVLDLKSGQVRNYREQVAAYALGLMEQYFADRWTCVLLFCDLQKVVTHEFTYAEAAELVEGILKAARDPERKPVLCDYCNWCAFSTSCKARVEAVVETTALMVAVERNGEDAHGWMLETMLEDPAMVGNFLKQAKVFDVFREALEERVKQLLEGDSEAVPGWRLRSGGTSEVVFGDDLVRLVSAGTISWSGVVGALGNMSGKKFRELWSREMATGEMPAVIRVGTERKASLVAVKTTKSKEFKS